MSISTRAATCGSCDKRLTRKSWYYRNGGYYCKKRCFVTAQAKAAKEAVEQKEKAEKEAAEKEAAEKAKVQAAEKAKVEAAEKAPVEAPGKTPAGGVQAEQE